MDGVTSLTAGARWPTKCLDACFDDDGCHGFVVSHGVCRFRGGSPGALAAGKQVDRDATLFILEAARRPSEQPTPVAVTSSDVDNFGIVLSIAIVATLVGLGALAIGCALARRNAKVPTAAHIEAFALETGSSGASTDDQRDASGWLWRSFQLLLPLGCAAPRKKEPSSRTAGTAPPAQML